MVFGTAPADTAPLPPSAWRLAGCRIVGQLILAGPGRDGHGWAGPPIGAAAVPVAGRPRRGPMPHPATSLGGVPAACPTELRRPSPRPRRFAGRAPPPERRPSAP